MRRRKGDKDGSGNQMDSSAGLTAMLDLIFNILAFFVITFNPPKPEKNFDVALPPPKLEESQSTGEQTLPDREPELFQELTITLSAGPTGNLASISVDGATVKNLRALPGKLRLLVGMIGGSTGEKVEAATVAASPKLKYKFLIGTVDACYQAGIKKINFAEQGAGSASGGDSPF